MKQKQLEIDGIIDPATGADVSFHTIVWKRHGVPSSISTGGNLYYHTLAASGSTEHRHECPEIILVLSGKVIHRVNGEKQLLSAGSLVFVRPGDVHGFLPAPKLEGCELLLLSFDLDIFLSLSTYLEDDSFLHKYTEPVLSAVFRVEEKQMNELSQELLSLNGAGCTPTLRRTHIKSVLVNLFARYFLNEKHYLKLEGIPDWLSQLCEKMSKPENFSAGLHRMQQLSGYTPEHLCKVFRRYLDKSPTEYINELRINHAAHLLSETGLEIAEIACRLNFQSLSRFYSLFGKQYGCSPARYRARMLSTRRQL